ncbi:hypothetical protein [Allorhizocola rhizosphaerae]|uniref:hypothetical protein n=1 Tax=Allorhizocola rhizosphaerae TaxID=1872709 RepID=UPI000E3B6045|nr:hypothetical protein [Allorhizocola rhizosphaerae]
MAAAREKQLSQAEAAKAQLMDWAASAGIPLVHIECLFPFAKTDFGLSVWLFLDSDASVERLQADGTIDRLRQEFLSRLSASGYPPDWLPDITFGVDSHENVVRDHEGSYLYRLR